VHLVFTTSAIAHRCTYSIEAPFEAIIFKNYNSILGTFGAIILWPDKRLKHFAFKYLYQWSGNIYFCAR